MTDLGSIIIGLGAFGVALWYGYRATGSLQRYRSVSDTKPATPTRPVDGEEVTITGAVAVDEPAPASEHIESLLDTPGRLALYEWRVQSPQGKNRFRLDFENRTITRKRTTIESGIEAKPFTVDDGTRQYLIDPERLLETDGGPSVETVELSAASTSSPLFGSDWASENLHLDNHSVDRSLDRVDVLAKTASDPQRSEYRFGVKALPEGESVAVHGSVSIEDGVPVLRGTDDTSLAISDRGADGLVSGVRSQLLKRTAASVGALIVAGYLVYAALWSVPL